ncbi:uncharacterized protein MYCFIDRAFT_80083 [Pseudocercospora fijiensis CIRAD86]|uniref:F-box domain-containing protein n=1 Tax=Pseudocercospora fijiensis (strain CIRAD86) TaxID=383855 RepID=N1QBU8_PSEFD|nr:uncharacterized protein MYCFIDRAFT_80083 [Pseudocercospora fijiensis CIRAD86]EME88703.1 hypothetical protein MYCFIDRAFT_80083 [Pseudocercospora fijiensis CIRAD86]
MADRSAASRTFCVTELLEMILVNLDVKDITKLKRVCKDWKEVIATSKQLRQICFLEPIEPTRAVVGSVKNFWEYSGLKIVSLANNQAHEQRSMLSLAHSQTHEQCSLAIRRTGFTFGKLREFVPEKMPEGEHDYVFLDAPGILLDSLLEQVFNRTLDA